MQFGIPQIIQLGIMFLALGLSMAQHGKPKTGKESFWTTLVAIGIQFGILYWGGFFN